MKTTRIISLCLTALAVMASSASAQRGQGQRPGTGSRPASPPSSERRPLDVTPPAGAQRPTDVAPATRGQRPTDPGSAGGISDDSMAERLQTRSQLSRELGLSNDQQGQIARIREQQRAEIVAINQNRVLSQEQRQEQIAATIQKSDDQVRRVLNTDQLRKLEQIRVKDRDGMQAMQNDAISERLQTRSQLSRELGLSDEQQSQVARIREQQRTEIAAMNQNRLLTQEQRQEQIAATIRKHNEEVRALLKQEQLQKLEQIGEPESRPNP